MKLAAQQRQQLRETLAPSYPLPSKPVLWILRGVFLVLIVLWIAGGLYLNNQVKQDEQRMEQARIEAQRRDERIRRGAQYQQELKERTKKPQSRNALDNL